MCAFGGISASGALAKTFRRGKQGRLTKFNCPGALDLRGN